MNWTALGLGAFLGVSNIGLMGSLISKGNLPVVDFPVGSYTSYEMEATKDGYRIRYNANDPKVMIKTEDVVKPSGGLFGGKSTTVNLYEEYTMNGKVHLDGGDDASKLTAKEIACIKAEGAGSSTGGVLGASVAAKTAPALSQIPIIGWVASGWATMFGQKQGANLGGDIAKAIEGC
tara:strand:- start:133 stop:663 length:531 start_codon:yes stop_codon:yes gene_type:complete